MSCFFVCNLLLFLLVYADSANSRVHYYITPSLSIHCPGDPCLTLVQFAADSTSYLGNETNISLSLLPGNHSLDRELSLSHADNLSMTKDTRGNGTVFVECGSQSGRFSISETTFATIKDLHFIGCGGNRISRVEQFIVEDTIFQGVEGRGTALVLNEVTAASIAKSSFLSNTRGSTFVFVFSNLNLLDYLYTKRNPLLAVGGAVYTAFSNVSIISSKFADNTADIGGALFAQSSRLHVIGSTCNYNKARFGGVMTTSESSVIMENSNFSENTAEIFGGVMITYRDSFSISGSTFTTNNAGVDSGVMETYESVVNIAESTFSDNTADNLCGVICAANSSFSIHRSIFTNNRVAKDVGVMYMLDSLFNITNSTITDNRAAYASGAVRTSGSLFYITNSNFTNNSAADGGVMFSFNSSLYITNSTFMDNSAADVSGVIYTYDSSFNITSSSFTNNSAAYYGGVMAIFDSSFIITHSTFTNNSAGSGIISASSSSFNIVGSSFYANKADSSGGIMFTIECSTHITDGKFDHNSGSLYIFNSNLTFSGYTRFGNCAEPPNKRPGAKEEGGAITSFQSTVIFTGVSSLLNNQARHGGAILATESKIMMHGETTIANNAAIDNSGGGISLQQSYLEIKRNCIIFSNRAMRGGGIHATSSTVAVHQPGTLQFINNRAENGGGINLESNAKLYVLKPQRSKRFRDEYLLVFKDNHAHYGGAIHVADDTNSGACSPDNECFIQTLSLHQWAIIYHTYSLTNILLSGNTASKQGANLFGGILDRCIPSPFAEVYRQISPPHYSGVSYLGEISNIALDTMSSLPVRVCFCTSNSEPDCSYQPPTIKIKKGEAFTVSLVAVDQVYRSADANIISSLSSQDGGFSEGQQSQSLGRYCSNITFNVFSPHNSETINLFADGPCGSSTPSIRRLKIQFTNCTCPIGFQPSDSDTRCECLCDSQLSPHITDCNPVNESLVRVNMNSWITYINHTVANQSGYVIHPNCPFDYCQPPTENISMNLNIRNGADTQCAYNRSGLLCGACQKHLSLSLGSSRCLPCQSHWRAVFVVILLAAAIAGILLVTALLALNMTVAVGLINGFIFYANIVAANSAIFFPSSEPSFPTVFVAWLNLDIGIDVCFFDGLDAYTKTWLQLAFPVYIISLVIILIIISECSPRFAGLIGKRDPIATLATLILLSYAKLLSVTITALSFAVLDYPDGSRKTVWLPDGNVQYLQGKHIALVFVALLIILIGVPYTILLFLWQWLVRAPNWKVFKWTRNTKLNAFVSVHHAPYNSKYRYWTGLLLLLRVVLYITVSIATSYSDKPQSALLVTLFLVGGLFFLNGITGFRAYKNSMVDILETGLYLNLLSFAAFSLYDFKTDIGKQTAVAYTSTIITFILLVGVITYHLHLLVRKDRLKEEVNEHPPAPLQPAKSEVTHSVIEIPNHRNQSPPPEANSNEIEVTPVYQ